MRLEDRLDIVPLTFHPLVLLIPLLAFPLALLLQANAAAAVRKFGDTLHRSGDHRQSWLSEQDVRVNGQDADAEALLVAVAGKRCDTELEEGRSLHSG